MKRIIYILCFLGLVQVGWGQQETQYSQYMFNQMAYNPAYAGSRLVASATAVFRKQWWGFPGAPTTGNISFHSPIINERHGLGVNFVHDQFGVIAQNFLEVSYAYRIPVAKGQLALGLSGGFTNYTNRFSEVTTRDPDQVIPQNDLTAWLPRAGTGIYYNSDKFYAGLSSTNFLAGRYFRFNNTQVQDVADRQRSHYYAMVGGIVGLAEDVDLRPSATFKYVDAAPWSLDLNATVFFSQTFGVGAGYRTSQEVLFMLEYLSPRYFRFGYAFDYPLNGIQNASAGTHEFMLGIDLKWGRSRFLTPRFF